MSGVSPPYLRSGPPIFGWLRSAQTIIGMGFGPPKNRRTNAPVGRASIKRRWASQYQMASGEPVSKGVGRASEPVSKSFGRASQYQKALGEPVSIPVGRHLPSGSPPLSQWGFSTFTAGLLHFRSGVFSTFTVGPCHFVQWPAATYRVAPAQHTTTPHPVLRQLFCCRLRCGWLMPLRWPPDRGTTIACHVSAQ